jgi:MoxR-like ATPase
MTTLYGALLVSQPADVSLTRQVFIANLDGRVVTRSRLTDGKQGRANAWTSDPFTYESGEPLIGEPVAIPVSDNDIEDFNDNGFPRVLIQKLIRKHSLGNQELGDEAITVADSIFQAVDNDPSSLAQYYIDNRGQRATKGSAVVSDSVIRITPVTTQIAQQQQFVDERSLFIPKIEEFAHYIPRKFAGGVDELTVYGFALKNKLNVLLYGEAGTGKTSSSMWVASKLGLPFFAIPSNSALDYTQIVGGYIPNGTGSLSWADGAVTRLVRNGGVLLIGEVNTLAKNVQQFLMPLLDYRRSITIMENGSEVIKAHDNLLIIADMNPNYRGTQLLNEAWKDRFEIKLNYHYDKSIENKILKSESLLELAYGMRSRSRGADEVATTDSNTIFDTPVSTRILKTFEKIATGLNFDFACEVFVNNFDQNERPAVRLLLEANAYNLKEDLGITNVVNDESLIS